MREALEIVLLNRRIIAIEEILELGTGWALTRKAPGWTLLTEVPKTKTVEFLFFVYFPEYL